MHDLIRLSDVLVLPANKHGKRLRPIVDLVDSVHRFPSAAKLNVIVTRNKKNEGEYHYKRGSFEPAFIEISRINDSMEATLLHEVGHFLELALIPGSAYGQRQWTSDTLTSAWLQTVKASHSFKILQQIFDSGQCTRFGLDGRELAQLPVERSWVAYLLTPRELWARSYAQWIVGRGGDDGLIHFFKKSSSPSAAVPLQWMEDDFAAIEEQFTRIFSAIGWLR